MSLRIDGWSWVEICEVLDKKPDTVRKMVEKAFGKLCLYLSFVKPAPAQIEN